MAFMSVTEYNKPVTVDVFQPVGFDEPIVRINSGEGRLCMSPDEAKRLRDDLSDALTDEALEAVEQAAAA